MFFSLSALPLLTVQKLVVAAAGPPAGVRPLMLIGYSRDGEIAVPGPYTNIKTLQDDHGVGSLPEAGAFALSPFGGVGTIHAVNAGGANAGAYGSITTAFEDADAPTVAGDGTTKPADTLEVRVRFKTDGELGVDGLRYDFSTDNGFTYFGERELGTAMSIELPYGAGKYNLTIPNAANLITRANEARSDFLAHIVLTSGSVHGAADTTSDDGVPAVASTEDEAITLLATLITKAAEHVVKLSSVHGAADTIAAASFAAIPTPTNAATAAQAYNLWKAAYNAHIARTSGSIHGAADATNPTSGADLASGVITSGDEFYLATTGPSPDATQLVAAIRALRGYAGDFGVILFTDPMSGATLNTIKTELQELWKYGKFRSAIVAFRLPNGGETYLQYKAAANTSFGAYSSTEARVTGGGVRAYSPLQLTAGGYSRPLRLPAWWIAAARARGKPETSLQELPAAAGVELKDSKGNTLPRCFDEQETPWSVEVRMIGIRTNPQKNASGVYVTQDIALFAVDSPWVLGPYVDVANHLVETVQAYLVNTLGKGFKSPPGTPFEEDIREQLQEGAQSIVEAEGPRKGRCTEVSAKLAADAGLNGKVKWEMMIVPLNYNVNGSELVVGLSAIRLTGEVAAAA